MCVIQLKNIGKDTISELSLMYRVYSKNNKKPLELTYEGNGWSTNCGSSLVPACDFPKVVELSKGRKRLTLNASLQAPLDMQMVHFNEMACISDDDTVIIGHVYSQGMSPLKRLSMPPFQNLFNVPIDGTEEVLSDIRVNDVLGSARKAMKNVILSIERSLYALEMENNAPVLVGYPGMPKGGVVWKYLYGTGNDAYDECIEKLVGFSDRFSSCFEGIDLSEIYWFRGLYSNTKYFARVIKDSASGECSIFVY